MSCQVSAPSQIIKPSDGTCNVVLNAQGIPAIDPQDPDCKTSTNACGVAANDILLSNSGITDCPHGQACEGNPINPGAGVKFEQVSLYRGVYPSPLNVEMQFLQLPGTAFTAPSYSWRNPYNGNVQIITDNGYTYARVVLPPYSPNQFNYFHRVGTAWVGDPGSNVTLTEITNASGVLSGFKVVDVNDSVYSYTLSTGSTTFAGLYSITTYDGRTVTLAYPAAGQTTMTDSFGHSVSFVANSVGMITSMTAPDGGITTLTWDIAGSKLLSIKWPDTKIRSFVYENLTWPNALTGIIDENGNRYASWTYDAAGNATGSWHGNILYADQVTLSYNANGTTTATDPLGGNRTYQFSMINGIIKATGLSQPCTTCGTNFSTATYDANGNVASRTDFKGNTTCYAYNLTRNLETVRVEGIAPLAACPANLATYIPSTAAGSVERKTTSQWHATLRLPTLISEPGRTTAYGYDPITGNLLSRTVTDTASARSRTWTYTYTTAVDLTLPNLLKTVKGPRTDALDITRYGYYPNGDLKTVTDALGHVTSITSLDAVGRPLSITDANGVVTSLTYTPRGWLASRKVGLLTASYSYDGVGQITRVTLPDGSHLDYSYDAAHRLTDIANAKLDHVHYTLDDMGNRIKEDVYDSAGKLSLTRSRVFDSLNRLAQDIRAYNATTGYATNYAYDANGNLTQILDARNNATLYGYDALNRLSRSTDAALGVTQYAYDALDQLNSVTDPKSLNTRYAVNVLGEQTQLASPDSGLTNRSFDSAGNLLGATDARGIAATYTYDALNRPVTISFPATGENIGYTWDSGAGCSFGVGRICQETDADGTTAFAYDDQGNLTLKTRTESGASFATRYVYDAANRLITIMTPTGETLNMTRDMAGHIRQLDDTNAGGTSTLAANIQYDGTGQATSQRFGNGVTQNTAYTLSGQPSGASAVRPLNPVDIDASTVRLFLSGSYLKQSLLEPALLGLMQPGSLSVFHDGSVNAGSATPSGLNYRAYFGVANTSAQNAAVPASLSGKKVLVVDRSLGDSIYGITPVALAMPISTLSLDAACAPTGKTDSMNQWLWACPGTANAIPDAGVADTEPALFSRGSVYTGLPVLNQPQLANLTSTPVVGQAIGIIVTDNFRSAGAGGTDALPSLSTAQVASLMGAVLYDWNTVVPAIPVGHPISVCRLGWGAGAQIAINELVFGTPCWSGANGPAEYLATIPGVSIVIENDSPAALARCMGYVQNGTPAGQTISTATGAVSAAPSDRTHITLPAGGYGIGLMSLTRPSQNATSEPYHFIAMAGAAPTIENAVLGQYDLIVESVMTRRNATTGGIPPLAGGQLDLYNTLATSLGKPALLGAAKTPSLPGVAALLANGYSYDPATTLYNGQPILLNPVLRVGRFGNTCTPLQQLQ